MVGVASPWTVIGSETDISFTGDSPAALTALAGVEFTPVDVLVGVAGVSGISGSSKFGTAEDVGTSADDVGPSDLGVSLGCVDALSEELGVSDCDGSSGCAGVFRHLTMKLVFPD